MKTEDWPTRDQTHSGGSAVNYLEADPKRAGAAIELVKDLVRDTAVWDDELEFTKLRKLPLNEQLTLGIVLREARLQEELPPELRQERLARVSNIQEARTFLEYGY